MLKLNLKLGGGNVQMAPMDQQNNERGAGLALMFDQPTMVCGTLCSPAPAPHARAHAHACARAPVRPCLRVRVRM